MKILIVQDFLRSGGTERQSILLAGAFHQAGHATTLLTFRPGGALARTVAAGVTHHVLQPVDCGLDWFAPGLTGEAAQLRPDIVLCMGRMANCYAGALQARLPASAVVATMRTGKPLPWLFRRSLRQVRAIVANSQDAMNTLHEKHGVPLEKMSFIYNSLVFPSAESLGPNVALRTELGASPTTTVLLCVAMFRPEKNQRELIEIAAGLPAENDWQLWLAGDGPARAAAVALVAQKQLTTRVKFLGFHRDPSPLYRAADVAVHASWSEALSNFLIEAQAHGLPAVAYEAQGIAECFHTAGPYPTGWAIQRENRSAFQAALVRLMQASPEERDWRSSAARQFARTTFDPARQVNTYLNFFHELIRSRP